MCTIFVFHLLPIEPTPLAPAFTWRFLDPTAGFSGAHRESFCAKRRPEKSGWNGRCTGLHRNIHGNIPPKMFTVGCEKIDVIFASTYNEISSEFDFVDFQCLQYIPTGLLVLGSSFSMALHTHWDITLTLL
jgi:hypothetical protein